MGTNRPPNVIVFFTDQLPCLFLLRLAWWCSASSAPEVERYWNQSYENRQDHWETFSLHSGRAFGVPRAGLRRVLLVLVL